MNRGEEPTTRTLRLFLVAGEPSGDALGAALMTALRRETQGHVRFEGVGGAAMRAAGLDSLFDAEDLAVMGLAEVLPRLPRLRRRLHDVVAAARAAPPDAVVTIDSPSFSLRVQRRLAGSGVPRIHYVAPQVWAWKPWRARTLGRELDHLLTLLPFEPPLFTRHGLAATFVGHPAAALPPLPSATAAREALGLPPEAPLLCVLPGSRQGELRRLLPVFADTVARLAAARPDLHVVLPTLGHLAPALDQAVAAWPVPCRVVVGAEARHTAFSAAQAALAASGTVTVELAAAGLPAVIAYRVHPLTALVARRMLRVPYASLPNLLAGRPVQPEFLQDACRPEPIARALAPLLDETAARRQATAESRAAARAFGHDGRPPSERAACAILAAIDQPRSSSGTKSRGP